MPFKKTDTGIVHFVSSRAGLWTEIVSAETGFETSQLLAWSEFGGVYLNDSRIFSVSEIKDQDYLRIHTNPRRFPLTPLQNRVVFQNDDLLIVNKPAGLPCHPTVDNLKENLWRELEAQLELKLYPTHRLDVPTSGLIVLTKTAEAQIQFQQLLIEKKVHKIYQALVLSPGPQLGLHEHYMEKTRYAPKTVHDHHRPNTQICQLRILNREDLGSKTRLEIELITGRTHQIRAQLSFLGFPILDDSLYADFENGNQDERIQLRCICLSFPWRDGLIECHLDDPLT
jgi:23S rRNA pseudouridine1911/1915/1917 synthase